MNEYKLPSEIKIKILGWTKDVKEREPKLECPICDSPTRTLTWGIYECLFCGTLINLSRPALDILYIKTGKNEDIAYMTYRKTFPLMEEEQEIVDEWVQRNKK